MRCVLGIDTGGSKCEAMAVGGDGSLLGWSVYRGVGAQRQRSMMGSGRGPEAVLCAVETAMRDVECDALSIVCSLAQLPIWPSLRRAEIPLTVRTVGEYAGALSAAGVRAGIVALVGTGALAHGLNNVGRALTLDGMGPMIGDFGSGYQIGDRAIRAALKAGWHPRHQTSLADVVWKTLQGMSREGEFFSPIEYLHSRRDRAEVASLAEVVDAHAVAGDAGSIKIMNEAADDFADTVCDLAASLGMNGPDPYPLIAKGSVITRSEIYWQRFRDRVQEFAPNLKPQRMSWPPVLGYVLEYAVSESATGIDPGFRDRLLLEVAGRQPSPAEDFNSVRTATLLPDRPLPWNRS